MSGRFPLGHCFVSLIRSAYFYNMSLIRSITSGTSVYWHDVEQKNYARKLHVIQGTVCHLHFLLLVTPGAVHQPCCFYMVAVG